MNAEQEKRLADIVAADVRLEHGYARGEGPIAFLFVLVKELREENARLASAKDRRILIALHEEQRERADRAEQQLAAVTAERDELRREVERLTKSFEEERALKEEARGDVALLEKQKQAWRQKAEKAEAERDALRVALTNVPMDSSMRALINKGVERLTPERASVVEGRLNAAAEGARELARLKKSMPPKRNECDGTCSGDDLGDCSHAADARLKGEKGGT